ncbi:MAG: Spy/CpxP family protein refolding chaperone [Candidatus Rokuibacteriota bacterium]
MMLRRRRATGFTLALALVAAVAARGTAAAQHGGHGQHGSGQAHHLVAQRCLEEFKTVVADGRGFGMAFAADQNGYPGPMHVLELKEVLTLTPEQEARTRELHAAVRAQLPKSQRLLDAEQRLERLFADRAATEERIRAAVLEVERARTDVRLVHLLAHLRTRELLTEEQRRLYHRVRWGAH